MTNLRPDAADDAHNPVWSPDGKVIYYSTLRYAPGYSGQLRVIRPDGTGDRALLDGNFSSIAVSSDGARLAVTTGLSGGGLLLLDSSGRIADTLLDSTHSVHSARFGRSADRLYYCDNTPGFFRLNLVSQALDTVLLIYPEQPSNFDVWGDSLIVFNGRVYDIVRQVNDTMLPLWYPQFLSSDPSVIRGSDGEDELIVFDRKNGSQTRLEVRPYFRSCIAEFGWSPDGGEAVVSAAQLFHDWETYRPGSYELWLLRR